MKNCKQLLRLICNVRNEYPDCCSMERCLQIFKYARQRIKILKMRGLHYTKRYFIRAIRFLFDRNTRTSKILRKIFLINFASPVEKRLAAVASPPRKKTEFFCHVCCKFFIRKFHFLQHLRMHYDLLMYRCDECQNTFAQQNGLNYHRSLRKCGGLLWTKKAARTPTITTRHLLYEYCETCKEFYRHGATLRNHILRKHATNDLFLGLNKDQQFQLLACMFIYSFYSITQFLERGTIFVKTLRLSPIAYNYLILYNRVQTGVRGYV